MRKIILIVAVLVAAVAWGDIIRGRIADQDTGEPLMEATVRYMRELSEGSYNVQTVPVDTAGYFTFFTDGRGTLDISVLGYYDKRRPVMGLSDSKRDTLDIGIIGLKISPQLLKMVEVTARARRFTMRGDTIVFNPRAFRLNDGARLDELIKQLPGVEMSQDGKLSWNGKPIRLTMDGEDLFGGDAIVNQLPAEAVQNIKAYNKASDLSQHTGRDDGTEDMVLDLTIKPGFLDRWYGDVKAGYQTEKNYEAELVMHRLSKDDPVLVFADANNMEKQHRRYMNRSMSSWGYGFGNEQGASAGYQHNWSSPTAPKDKRSYASVTSGLAHDDNWNTEGKQTDNYLPGTAASRVTSETYHRNHGLNPMLNTNLRWYADSLNFFALQTNFNYNQLRSRRSNETEQEVFDTPDNATPTLTQQTASHSQGHKTKFDLTGSWNHKLRDGDVVARAKVNMSDNRSEQWTDRTITDHRAGDAISLLTQHAVTPSTTLATQASVTYKYWMTPAWLLNVVLATDYNRQHNRRSFETDDLPDEANSYRDLYRRTGYALTLGSTLKWRAVTLMPQVTGRWQRESQDYSRGMLDTAAVRRHWLTDPGIKVTWKPNRKAAIEVNYNWKTTLPDLLQTIGYRDNTDPLFITEGNPGLKNIHTHDFSIKVSVVDPTRQLSLGTTFGLNIADRATVTAWDYDPATAIYTSRPITVDGSRVMTLAINYDHGLGEKWRLRNDLKLNAERHYGYLTLTPDMTERTLSRESALRPKDKLSLIWNLNWLQTTAFVEIDASRLHFSASPEQNTTLWNNKVGVEFNVKWRNFEFKTYLTERMRRGYAAGGMNRDWLEWDAELTCKVLKNKARITLEARDILNQATNFWSSEETAYQRVTQWSNYRHHWVGISFAYHLDAKKKD